MERDEAPEDTPGTADSAPLIRLFGRSIRARILAVLFEADTDLNISSIAHQGEAHRDTVSHHLDRLVDLGLVMQSRTVGNSRFYTINPKSAGAASLEKASRVLAEEFDAASAEENANTES